MRTLPGTSRTPALPTAPTLIPATPAPSWPGAAIMDDPDTAGVLHSAWSGDAATVVPEPTGRGQDRLVALLAATLAGRADLRIGIARTDPRPSRRNRPPRRRTGPPRPGSVVARRAHPSRPQRRESSRGRQGPRRALPNLRQGSHHRHHRPLDLRRPQGGRLRRDDRGRSLAGHLRRPRRAGSLRAATGVRGRPRPDRTRGDRLRPAAGPTHPPDPTCPPPTLSSPPTRTPCPSSPCAAHGGSDRPPRRSRSLRSTRRCRSRPAAHPSTLTGPRRRRRCQK